MIGWVPRIAQRRVGPSYLEIAATSSMESALDKAVIRKRHIALRQVDGRIRRYEKLATFS